VGIWPWLELREQGISPLHLEPHRKFDYIPYMDFSSEKLTPAVIRGFAILEVLNREGACRLETLSKLMGLPKSSLRRLVHTLSLLGLVSMDHEKSLVSANARVQQNTACHQGFKDMFLREGRRLTDSLPCVIELWKKSYESLVMDDRLAPEKIPVTAWLRIGHQRMQGELDSLLITLINNSDTCLPQYPWAWIKNKIVTLNKNKCKKILQTYDSSVACDQGVNVHGNKRYAVAIQSHADMQWVLAAVLHENDIKSCEAPLIEQLAKSAKRLGFYLMDQEPE
jgi:hypothetical protein